MTLIRLCAAQRRKVAGDGMKARRGSPAGERSDKMSHHPLCGGTPHWKQRGIKCKRYTDWFIRFMFESTRKHDDTLEL